jgi:hypothetical protein
MYRTVGAVRHNSKSSGTQNYDSFLMAVVMEGVYFLLYFNIFYFNMIYFLTAIGLTSGGSSAVHIYTQTIHRPTQWNGIHRTHNNKNT